MEHAGNPHQQFEGPAPFETLLVELSTRCTNLDPTEVDREIEDACHRVCEPKGVDLAVLWQWSGTASVALLPTQGTRRLRTGGH